MKKYILLIAITCCLLISWQNSNAQITQAGTYSSINPKVNIGTAESDMTQMDIADIFSFKPKIKKGGIIGNAASGKITISVYYYLSSKSDGKGLLLYQCYLNSNSNGAYIELYNNIQNRTGACGFLFGYDYWYSTNVQERILNSGYYVGELTSIYYSGCGCVDNVCAYYNSLSRRKTIPVIIEATIEGSNTSFSKFKVPGIGEYDALEYFSQQELKKGNLPIGNACNGSNTTECQTLREMRHGDLNQVIVTTHRGFWGYGNVAEVSMSGLQNGYNNKYVSIELDVQQSKDGEVLLLHDQKVNRMISFMATQGQEYPTFDIGNQNDARIQAAWIQNLNYNTTTPNIPKTATENWTTYPALKNGRMIDRRGQATTDAVARFDEVLTYIQSGDKPILLSLDIKEKEQTRYMETLSKCLTKAKAAGCLHKIVIKPGSTLELPVETFKTYLSDPSRNQWVDFAYRINLILIVVKNTSTSTADGYVPPTKAFIDGWLNVPSMIGVEYIYKYNDATLDVLLKSLPEFDNKSVIAYTKAKGIRTGAFWEIATESRGVPSGTVYAWYSKTSPDKNLTLANGLVNVGVDARNNPEFTIAPPSYNTDATANFPGMINTDRPDLVQAILELNGRYNTKSKRP